MPTFPEKHVVAGRYQILQSDPHSYFYGFLHEGSDKKKENLFVKLALLHPHLGAYKGQAYPKNFFLSGEWGLVGESAFVAFPKEDKISCRDFLESIQNNQRKRDHFFLNLLEWIHQIHLQSFSIPYLNPDLIFVSGKTLHILGPFDFFLEKLDPSVDEVRRFFSPRYLGHSYNTNIKLTPIDDYYPFLVMFLETLQGSMIFWDSASCYLKVQEERIPYEYRWMLEYLSVKKMPEKEEDLYQRIRLFLEDRLSWNLRIQSKPINIPGTFLWNEQTRSFPGCYKISFAMNRLSLEFFDELPDEQESECCYRLANIQAIPSSCFHSYDGNRLEWFPLEDKNEPEIILQYEQKIKLEMKIVCHKNFQSVVLLNKKIWDGTPLQSSSNYGAIFQAWVSPHDSVQIQINPGSGLDVDGWTINEILRADIQGQNTLFLDPSSHERKIHCQLRSVGNPLKTGIIAVLFLVLLAGASWFYYSPFLDRPDVYIPKMVDKPLLPKESIEKNDEMLALEKNDQGFMEYKRKKDGMIMIEIPEGKSKLKIGNKASEEYIHNTYWIDKYEVCLEQFLKFINDQKMEIPSQDERIYNIVYDGTLYIPAKGFQGKKPVTNISFEMANQYAHWAGADLPTESEWTKAASWKEKDQIQYDYPWGNKKPESRSLAKYLNSIENGKSIKPIDYAPEGRSPYGLYNMAGNAGEFCKISLEKNDYILKGGSFYELAIHCQVYFQQHIGIEKKYSQVGFRCVIRSKK